MTPSDSQSMTPDKESDKESWRILVAESGVVVLGTSTEFPFKSHHDSGLIFIIIMSYDLKSWQRNSPAGHIHP